jgi:protein TonB
MPPYQASPPQKSSRHRWLILATFVVVIVAGVISFIFNGTGEPEKEKMEDYQIVDVTIPPPPPPPPPVEEDEFEEPEEIEEFIEPLEMSSDTSSSSDEASEVDLGIDIGDLVASSGAGGFVLDIPRFGRGGGGGDGSGDSLGGGELDSPATPASKSQPIYPAALLKKGVGGKVLVTCTVSPEGLTLSASIKQSSGHPDLDKAAIAAVNRWKFKPGTKAGKKVKSIVIVPFNFEVKKI